MIESQLEQLRANLRRLATFHATTLAVLEESEAIIQEELRALSQPDSLNAGEKEELLGWKQPVVNKTLLSVVYRGRQCFLGNTLPLKLFERLLRRPNQYLSYDVLLQDVWGGIREVSSVRSVVKELRAKLRNSGLSDLSAAIDGRVAGHYGLILTKLP